jgi:hypothetical protein
LRTHRHRAQSPNGSVCGVADSAAVPCMSVWFAMASRGPAIVTNAAMGSVGSPQSRTCRRRSGGPLRGAVGNRAGVRRRVGADYPVTALQRDALVADPGPASLGGEVAVRRNDAPLPPSTFHFAGEDWCCAGCRSCPWCCVVDAQPHHPNGLGTRCARRLGVVASYGRTSLASAVRRDYNRV